MREGRETSSREVGARVAVTGVGVVCSLGRGAGEVWEALSQGRRGFGAATLFDTGSLPGYPVAQIREPVVARRARLGSRLERFLATAADEAVGGAGLAGSDRLRRYGIALGNANGGMLEAERWLERAPRSLSAALRLPSSASTDAIAARFGLRGPRLTNTTACSSSAGAIALAAERIRDGDVEGMIAGGGDPLCRLTYSGFGSLRLMDRAGCRPFDRGRKGLTLGEGAGILLLEEWQAALARGVAPLAEILDHGATCDAHHVTSCHPEGRGMESAMREALERSGVRRSDVGYINAHGTATSVNDAAEGKAIARLFRGDGSAGSARPAVSSTKSMHGHLLGGSGAVEAVAVILSLVHGSLPVTAGLDEPDPALDLDLVAGEARPEAVRLALSNSFGFGGGNVVLLFASAGQNR